jgi:hypothetical protein
MGFYRFGLFCFYEKFLFLYKLFQHQIVSSKNLK